MQASAVEVLGATDASRDVIILLARFAFLEADDDFVVCMFGVGDGIASRLRMSMDERNKK